MQRPTILLADSDGRYLRSLEFKFLEELGDKINLEIITDEKYLEEYFAEPRTLELLMISEKFYFSNLDKHHIQYIFVLTEDVKQNSQEGKIRYLFKFTSSAEIYQIAVRALAGQLEAQQLAQKTTKIVMITSANGGVGKTTLALGLAGSLSMRMMKVLYVDVEMIHSFQRWLTKAKVLPDCAYIVMQTAGTKAYSSLKQYIQKDDFDYFPPLKNSFNSLGIAPGFYRNFLQAAKQSNDYDVIVVDTDHFFHDEKVWLMTFADVMITVLNQTKTSMFATEELIKNIRIQENEKFIFICNSFREERKNLFLQDDYHPTFMINGYVGYMEQYEELTLKELELNQDIRKISYLVT